MGKLQKLKLSLRNFRLAGHLHDVTIICGSIRIYKIHFLHRLHVFIEMYAVCNLLDTETGKLAVRLIVLLHWSARISSPK